MRRIIGTSRRRGATAPRALRSPAALAALAGLAALGVAPFHGAAVAPFEARGPSSSPPSGDAAPSSGAAALADAAATLRLVLIHFPAPAAARPEPLVDEPLPEELEARVVRARARAGEVRDLMDRWGIDSLPALLVVDPEGRVVSRWARTWAARAVLRRLAELDARLRESVARWERQAAEARAAWDEGRHEEAVGLAVAVTGAVGPVYPSHAGARALIETATARAREEISSALGQEGLVADRDLDKTLATLEARWGKIERIAARLARERARLEDRRIGLR